VRNSLVLLAALAAIGTDALAAERERLAVLQIDAQQGSVEPEQQALLGELLVSEVRKLDRFDVLSQADIESMLGSKKGSEFLACADAACLAQLAGPLNVSLVVSASVARFGEVFILNVKLVDLARAAVAASVSKKVPAEEKRALLDALPAGVAELFVEPSNESAAVEAPTIAPAETEEVADATTATSPAGRSALRNALFTDTQIDSLGNHGVLVTPQMSEIVERLNKRGYNQDEIHRFAIKHQLFSRTPKMAENWSLYYTSGLKLRGYQKFLDSGLSLTDYYNERKEGIALDACKWGLLGFMALNVGLGFAFREISPIDMGTTGSGSTQIKNEYRIYWEINFVLAGASLIGSLVCFIIDALDRGQVEPGFFEKASKREIIDVVEGAREARRDRDEAPAWRLAVSPWASDRDTGGVALSLGF